jgi:NDP-sugar pyrophosphorylase family protein
MNLYSPEAFFDLSESPMATGLFQGLTYVWEAVTALPAYIEGILHPALLGEIEEGAWIEPGGVHLAEGTLVQRGAIIRGPTIIGRDTVVRSGAYIRGHVLVGEGCMIGHATELRQTLVLNRTNIPHYNGVFTSLIGNDVLIGAFTTTANFLLSGKKIEVRLPG